MKYPSLCRPQDLNPDGIYVTRCPSCKARLCIRANCTILGKECGCDLSQCGVPDDEVSAGGKADDLNDPIAQPAPRGRDDDQPVLPLSSLATKATAPSRPVTSRTQATEMQWTEVMPFGEYALPLFPSAALPQWLREYVEAVAAYTATPVDMAGSLAFAAIATSVAKRFVVELSGKWFEPLNLFLLVAMPPGSRKSAVFRLMTHPINAHERAVNKDLEPAIAKAETQQKILQQRLNKCQALAAQAQEGAERQQLEELAAAMAEEVLAFKIPVRLRLVADDVTPEKTVSLLAEQDGRLAVMSPEGGIFDTISGRYSDKGGSNLDAILKGHSGDDIRVDRVGRPPDYVSDPALTLGLAVQPDVLRGLMDKPGFRGRGLLARFLYALPADNIGFRPTVTPDIPDIVSAKYTEAMARLLQIPAQMDDDGNDHPLLLKLMPDAHELFTAYRQEIETAMRPDGRLYPIKDWGSKLAGACARLAGLLHVAEHGNTNMTIGRTTISAAIAITRYFAAHALAAHAEMGADASTDGARTILAWVKRTEHRTFSKRNVHKALDGTFKRAADLEKPLEILVERGCIRLQCDNRPTGGRPAGPIYEVNPSLFEGTEGTIARVDMTSVPFVPSYDTTNGQEVGNAMPKAWK